VSTGDWQPYKGGEGESTSGRDLFVVTPFTRLARTHTFSVAGDALFTIGLAGTIFFLSPADAARDQVALYLLLTIAPFAVAAPFIGPLLDRTKGGRRWTIFLTAVCRVVVCIALVRHLDSVLFYPEAFLMLVFSKAYHISKSAVVPTTVRDDAELVEANSKLSLLSGLAVVVAAGPGLVLVAFDLPKVVIALAAVAFAAMAVVALKIPSQTVAPEPRTPEEKAELKSAGIRLAASAMALLRGIVGFLSFLLAFDFKDGQAWKLGVVAAAAQAGFLIGSFLSPRLRKMTLEETILIGSLVTVGVIGLGAAATGGLLAAALLSCVVGITSSTGKQAFDAIVQSDAPDANRGRSFARFETRFQIVWVIGALIPTAISINLQLGYFLIAVSAMLGTISYLLGVRGASINALDRVRAWRHRRRDGVDEEAAAQLGFRTDPVPRGESRTQPSPAHAADAPRPPVSPLSPAAEAAEQRRAEMKSRLEEEQRKAEEKAAAELEEAERALHEQDGEPDLDWHPR
jgi:hypothetical protein